MKKYKVVKEINVKKQDVIYSVVIGNRKHFIACFGLNHEGRYSLLATNNKVRDKYKNINFHIDLMRYYTYQIGKNEEITLMKLEFDLTCFYEDNTASTEIITIYEEK